MTGDTPPSDRSRFLVATVAVLLALGILAGGYAAISKPRDPAPRPQSGDVLLSTRLSVPPAQGASARVRLKASGTLRFSIDASGGALTATFGPPAPAEAGHEDVPDPTTALTWTVEPGAAPREERVYAAGLYVLRVASKAGSAPASVGVEIREVSKR